MDISSRLAIDIGDSSAASRVLQALLPEVKSNKSKAATVAIEVEGSRILISITASTIAATRALLNSYIRWISISLDIASIEGAKYG